MIQALAVITIPLQSWHFAKSPGRCVMRSRPSRRITIEEIALNRSARKVPRYKHVCEVLWTPETGRSPGGVARYSHWVRTSEACAARIRGHVSCLSSPGSAFGRPLRSSSMS